MLQVLAVQKDRLRHVPPVVSSVLPPSQYNLFPQSIEKNTF